MARKVGGRCTVDNILKDYQVYVFAEDIQTDDAKTANVNEGLFSDYASTPVNVAEYKFVMTAVIQATTMARSRLVPVTERMESKIHMVHMMEKH